jgi:1-deoxy-D-xylulose-5-phosphate reductoisomerase
MKIPIHNSLYNLEKKNYKSKSLNLNILNNLNLKKVDLVKFPLVKILNNLPKNSSLYETILITVNDYLVLKFLKKKIGYKKLINLIIKISNLKEFQKYKKIKPKNVKDIYNLRNYVHLKLNTLGI